jgi:hypothetical protein
MRMMPPRARLRRPRSKVLSSRVETALLNFINGGDVSPAELYFIRECAIVRL